MAQMQSADEVFRRLTYDETPSLLSSFDQGEMELLRGKTNVHSGGLKVAFKHLI